MATTPHTTSATRATVLIEDAGNGTYRIWTSEGPVTARMDGGDVHLSAAAWTTTPALSDSRPEDPT